MSDNIPPEVITKILCQLPVKSLLRFRCVSKSFKSLIDSPKFIKTHLKNQLITQKKPNNSNVKFILRSINNHFYSVDFSSVCNRNTTPQQLDHQLHKLLPYVPTQVQGSIHGLVLLTDESDVTVVWNLNTNKFSKLPFYESKPPVELEGVQGRGFSQVVCGLGYDSVSDDYKVVRTVQWVKGWLVSETMVYSLKLGVWRKIQDCPTWLDSDDDGTLAGGVLHWIASRGSNCPMILIGLNLETERWEQVAYPENFGMPLQVNLAVLGECLCLIEGKLRINNNARNFMLERVDVWVMKEYGVKESWVKLFSLDQLDGHNHFRYVRPVAYSETERDVLLDVDKSRFLWYNIDNKSLKPVRISGELGYFDTHVCLGTLVPVDGGGIEKGSKKNQEPETGDGAGNIEEGDDLVIKEFKLEI